MEDILEKFLLELNEGKIRSNTFIQFLNDYDGAYLYIKSNYEMILSHIYSYDYIVVMNFMYSNSVLKEVMNKRVIETFKCCSNPAFLGVLLDIYLEGKGEDEKKRFFDSYFDLLLDILPISNLFILFGYKDLDSSFTRKLDNKIFNHRKEYFKGFLSVRKFCKSDEELNDLTDSVVYLIDKLLEKENVDYENRLGYSSILFDEGLHSIAFIVGDSVLSIGDKEKRNIPHHRRILQSLILMDSSLGLEEVHIPDCIDVNARVDTDSEISKEELYVVYKELLDDNILWTDVKVENVGRLLKPNGILDGEVDVLEVGEVVVIDKDFIYDLNKCDLNDVEFWGELAIEFESRYREEKVQLSSKKR